MPKYPKRIAVLTSPSGAVIRDIITTTQRRYPIAQIVLYPTVVQGNKVMDDVVKNIQRVEADGTFDTMIIGRGGGSIEDLWPFNEERVARAIFDAKTPIISSVGHETDTTIADLVADVRAATPTAGCRISGASAVGGDFADRRKTSPIRASIYAPDPVQTRTLSASDWIVCFSTTRALV